MIYQMSNDINRTIKRLKECVEKSKLSYAELEKRTNIAKSSIQRYVSGVTKKIPVDSIVALSKAVGVSPSYIMGWDKEIQSPEKSKKTKNFGERIKKVRKENDLTQQEFADKLGIKRSTIANYEMGRNKPVDSVVALICKEFNVNESWLRKGTGSQFIQIPRDKQIEKCVKDMLKYESDSFKYRLIAALISLDAKDWGKLENIIINIQKSLSKGEKIPNNTYQYVRTDEEIETEVENYRRELIEEKRVREKSSALQDLKES